MSTSLSGQYQWTKKRAYGEGFKLNGKTLPPKKTPTPTPTTGNDDDDDTDNETETPNRTVEEIVKNFYDFAGNTPMDILSDALTEIMELRAKKAMALKTGS